MEEKMPDAEKRSHALPLFLSGAALGAVLGVIFAPGSGKETRRKLGEWMKEKGAKGKEQILTKGDQIMEALEAGKKAYKETERKHAGV